MEGGGGLADAWDRGFPLQLVIVTLYSHFVIQVWGSFIITEIYVVETQSNGIIPTFQCLRVCTVLSLCVWGGCQRREKRAFLDQATC